MRVAVATILDYLKNKDQGLKSGLSIRASLAGALSRGEEVHHYRIDWLRSSSMRVIDLLSVLAKEFNAAHPGDLCSAVDLVDVLVTALNVIKTKAGS